jgi:coenzyme F420-dependent glucose-6-phosphate dehydrogenase
LNQKIRVGYWAAHEQYSAGQLLDFAVAAEKGGFETVMCSDHFMPWFHKGARAGFAWAWMAACAAKTEKMQVGTGVTAPDRYHPAIIAQAFATMNEMFPGRITLGLGSGEAMNSLPLGIVWPDSSQRVLRLKEALEIITRLWSGKFEDYHGLFYQVRRAKLYTPPMTKIPIFVAVGGKRTARIAGQYADGVFLSSGQTDILRAFKGSVRKHGRNWDDMERVIEFKCSYDPDRERALESTKVWRSTAVPGVLQSSIDDPRRLEEKGAKEVSDAKLEEMWMVVTDVDELVGPITGLIKEGFTRVQVHSSSPDEMRFVEEFTKKALPSIREQIESLSPAIPSSSQKQQRQQQTHDGAKSEDERASDDASEPI